MSRYIDAEKLKESVEGLQDCYNGYSDTYDKSCIIGLIDEEPTADVVPVVRCKDCRYYEIYELKSDGTDDRRYRPSVCVKEKYAEYKKPDWFCADGEKVTE